MGYCDALGHFTLAGGGVSGYALTLLTLLWGQTPLILRFIPGQFRENAHHQIDLYNPYPYALALGGWLVVTREYSVRLPPTLVLAPKQQYRLAKRGGDLPLLGYPDFLIRFPDGAYPGAYVALLDEKGRLRKGLYLAPSPQVAFLPDSGTHITPDKKRISFTLPSETATGWEYVPWEADPITGVVRIGSTWRYTVADAQKEIQLYAPLRFSAPLAAYEGQAIHLTWEVEGRELCATYHLERWDPKQGWQKIAGFPCPSVRSRIKVEYYDPAIQAEARYRYRLRYELTPSVWVESSPTEVYTYRVETPLRIESHPGLVRLWVAQSQPIKVRLLDAHFVERLRIYDGWVNAQVENLFVWDTLRVREGAWVVVWTPQRRYWARLRAR